MIHPEIVDAALVVKRAAGQINVIVHVVGIVAALPHILVPGEVIHSLSLGAGNTGRLFDLETSHRVAEFKFIDWQGGAETIRQNVRFKDFFNLAEHETHKERSLYLLEVEHPLKFLRGGRALKSVFSKDVELTERFRAVHGDRFRRVREYYGHRGDRVKLVDLSAVVPGLRRRV